MWIFCFIWSYENLQNVYIILLGLTKVLDNKWRGGYLKYALSFSHEIYIVDTYYSIIKMWGKCTKAYFGTNKRFFIQSFLICKSLP